MTYVNVSCVEKKEKLNIYPFWSNSGIIKFGWLYILHNFKEHGFRNEVNQIAVTHTNFVLFMPT